MSDYDRNNIFARILRGELPCHKVYEDEETIAIMDIMPRGDGHVLVLPKGPARNIFDIDAAALASVAETTRKLAIAARAAMKADGITIQQFNEQAGGQVVFHLHMHIIPRWEGVPLRPHTGQMAQDEDLATHAAAIRGALGGG